MPLGKLPDNPLNMHSLFTDFEGNIELWRRLVLMSPCRNVNQSPLVFCHRTDSIPIGVPLIRISSSAYIFGDD